MKVKAIPAGEVAFILRRALGPMRDWADALADMRGEKTSVCGVRLMPAGEVHDGRCYRPLYTAAAIKEFIREVSAAGGSMKDVPIRTYDVDIDLDDERGWKHRKVKPVTAH